MPGLPARRHLGRCVWRLDVPLSAMRGGSRAGVVGEHEPVVIDETPTIEEVLTAWSDASLAAELARRLAKAGDKAVGADPEAAAVPEVASLVDSTVEHATQAAVIAKGTGDRLQGARSEARADGRDGDQT